MTREEKMGATEDQYCIFHTKKNFKKKEKKEKEKKQNNNKRDPSNV